jgi:hypothetical protein
MERNAFVVMPFGKKAARGFDEHSPSRQNRLSTLTKSGLHFSSLRLNAPAVVRFAPIAKRRRATFALTCSSNSLQPI